MEGVVEVAEEPEVTTFDAEVEKAWAAFRDMLARRLERIGDDEHVILELDVPEPDDGAAPYVQFAGFDGGGLRAEMSSNAYLAPEYRMSPAAQQFLVDIGFELDAYEGKRPADNFYVMTSREDAAMVAGDVVLALREVFDVIHPSMLREASGGDLSQAVLPDPGDMGAVELDAAYPVANSWDVMLLVHRTLYAVLGGVVERDDDGDWPLVGLAHAPIFVTVAEDQPTLRLWARVAHTIADPAVALREVNILNRDAHTCAST